LSWTPDNHIVFDMEENGTDDIWKISANGSGRERLTYQQGQNREPSTTADGRHIVFISNRSGSSQIWRMGMDDNDQKQLVNSTGSIGEPQGAPEGDSVLYLSRVNGQGGLFKVPLDSGKATEVIDKNIEFWAISPDGLRLAYSYRDQDAARTRVAVPFGGGSPLERFDLEPCYLMRWARDGSSLVYIAPDDNIWFQPIAGGPAKQLTHFQRDLDLISFAWSADGQQLAYARRSNAYDAVAFQIK
jgi:Tol biopolymer transport system component